MNADKKSGGNKENDVNSVDILDFYMFIFDFRVCWKNVWELKHMGFF